MQRLYSIFPQGGPGVGLLLLRITVMAMFALNLTHQFNFSSRAVYVLVVSLIGLISLGLLLGFLTPVLSVITCLTAVANLVLVGQSPNVVYVLRTLASAALFFLGPGAYSVDAKLFGRRVTVVPPRREKPTTSLT